MIADTTLPLVEILGAGAAGVAVVMCIIWMKHVKEMRAENTVHVENVTKTIERVASEFAKSTSQNMEIVERTAASFERTTLQLHTQTAQLVHEVLKAFREAPPAEKQRMKST